VGEAKGNRIPAIVKALYTESIGWRRLGQPEGKIEQSLPNKERSYPPHYTKGLRCQDRTVSATIELFRYSSQEVLEKGGGEGCAVGFFPGQIIVQEMYCVPFRCGGGD